MQYTFILNPKAGNGSAGKRRARIEAALAGSGLDARMWVTEEPRHAVDLAREAAAQGHAVVAVGGDGTVQEVSAGIIASGYRAPMGIIPVGTGNDFVKTIGMPGDPERAIAVLQRPVQRLVDYGRISWWDERAAGASTFLNAVGIGFDARVAQRVAGFKFLPGFVGYLAAALATLVEWKAPDVHIRMEREAAVRRYEGGLLLTTAGNGTCSGGSFYLTPNASVNDGLLDVCLIEAIPVRRILQLLPLALCGRHVGARGVHMHRASSLHLESTHPVPVHADGEMMTGQALRLVIEIVPGGLTLLAPESAPDGSR